MFQSNSPANDLAWKSYNLYIMRLIILFVSVYFLPRFARKGVLYSIPSNIHFMAFCMAYGYNNIGCRIIGIPGHLTTKPRGTLQYVMESRNSQNILNDRLSDRWDMETMVMQYIGTRLVNCLTMPVAWITKKYLTWHLTGWWMCCQPITCHFWNSFLTAISLI